MAKTNEKIKRPIQKICENELAEAWRKDIEAASNRIPNNIMAGLTSDAKISDNFEVQQLSSIGLVLATTDLMCKALVIPILSSSKEFEEIMSSIEISLSQYDKFSDEPSGDIQGTLQNVKDCTRKIINIYITQKEQINIISNSSEVKLLDKIQQSIKETKNQFQKLSSTDQEILQATATRYLQTVKSIAVEGLKKQQEQISQLYLDKTVRIGLNYSEKDKDNLQQKLKDIKELWDPLSTSNPFRSQTVSTFISPSFNKLTSEDFFTLLLETGLENSNSQEIGSFIKDQIINPRENQAEILEIAGKVVEKLEIPQLLEVYKNIVINLPEELESIFVNKIEKLKTTTDLVKAYNLVTKDSNTEKTPLLIETLEKELNKRTEDFENRSIFKTIITKIAAIFNKAINEDEHAIKSYIKKNQSENLVEKVSKNLNIITSKTPIKELDSKNLPKPQSASNDLPKDSITKARDYLYEEAYIEEVLNNSAINHKNTIIVTALSLGDADPFMSNYNLKALEYQLDETILSLLAKNNDKTTAVFPLNTGYNHWVSMVVKHDKDSGELTFIYNDPMGTKIDARKDLVEMIEKTTEKFTITPKIIDLHTKQQTNAFDCGPFMVDNLIKLAIGEEILSTEQAANIDVPKNLRQEHAADIQLKTEVQKTNLIDEVKSIKQGLQNHIISETAQSNNNNTDIAPLFTTKVYEKGSATNFTKKSYERY